MGLIRLNNQSLTNVTALPSAVDTAFKRVYTANSQTPVQWTTNFSTLLTFNDVVVNAGEKVYLSYRLNARHSSSGQHHTAYVITYSGSASGTVGDGAGWGFGINDTDSGHQLDTGFLSLSDFPQSPFNSTGTFTMLFKGRAANTSGYWSGESSGTAAAYAFMHAQILVG